MDFFTWTAALDILIVAILILGGIFLIKTTRSQPLIRSVIAISGLYLLSQFLELQALKWVLEQFVTVVLLSVIVLFQPELRRATEKIRKGGIFGHSQNSIKNPTLIKHILTAVDTLSKHKVGALIALEFQDHLDDYTESGVPIDGQLTSDLLVSLFWPGSPTHDGAVVIHDNKVVAAGCLLPLTESKLVDRRLGTRHMAAMGLSENSDALVIAISEETGTISIVENGNMTRYLNREALETRLFNLYKEPEKKS
ncbi:TIGR00159 family protein [bacterium]|nr:TIGR00159 family protein [bacterium]